MIKQIKKILSIVLVFALFLLELVVGMPIITAFAEDYFTEGNYMYTVSNGEANIISYFGGDSEFLIIPSTLGGNPVTTIGNGTQTVFSNNKTRGVVIFPNSVTKINKQAIYDYNVTY